MDDFDNDHDHDHESSSDEQEQHEHEHEQDDAQTLEDADTMEVDEDDDFNEDDDDQDDDENDPDQDPCQEQDPDPDPDPDHDHDHDHEPDPGDVDPSTRVDPPPKPSASSTSAPSPSTPKFRPRVRPEALTASLYDIVPTMAAPQATSINAMAITPDLRYWMTGGSDGYVRKYDGPGTINGKQLLTVAQRHPFVDSVVKAGILMGYWPNFEPARPGAAGGAAGGLGGGGSSSSADDKVRSPVYALAVHKDALWSLAGTESGSINLHSVRYDEGKVIISLPAKGPDRDGHASAVSVLQLAPDEFSVLSGSWDKRILDWDLNTGMVANHFDASGGQISAIELRPLSGNPVPPEAAQEPEWGDTFKSSSRATGTYHDGFSQATTLAHTGASTAPAEAVGDGPAGSDNESLFGSPGGSLFGEGQMGGGGNAFGGDDDNEFSHAMLGSLEDAPGEGLGGDTTMVDAPPPPDLSASQAAPEPAEAPTSQTQNPEHTQTQPPPQDPSQQAPDQPPSSQAAATAAVAAENAAPPPSSPTLVLNPPASTTADPTQLSPTTFLAASIDGTIRLWDRRMPAPIARIATRTGVPPWCMGACWAPAGDALYAGRRNGTVEEFSIHKARGGYPGWQPEATIRFPAGSGAVSAVRSMPNGRHLVCASHDILRLYDLRASAGAAPAPAPGRARTMPFLVIPGPPRAGVTSQLYVDPSARFMITAAGTRGWEGSSTETIIGYEIRCLNEGG